MSHFPHKMSAYFSVFMSALVAGSAMAQTAPAQQPARPVAPAAAAPAASAPAPAAAAPAPAAAAPAPAAAAPAPAAPAPAAPAGVSEVHEHDIYPGLQVVITSLKRTPENTMTLRWDMINTTDQPITMEDMRDSFDDMPDNLYKKMNLLDLTNRRSYTALKGYAGRHVGRAFMLQDRENLVIPAKGKMSFWLKYANIPNIQSISVEVPGVEPFSQIPITN
mgnify:CR=1 FL=1